MVKCEHFGAIPHIERVNAARTARYVLPRKGASRQQCRGSEADELQQPLLSVQEDHSQLEYLSALHKRRQQSGSLHFVDHRNQCSRLHSSQPMNDTSGGNGVAEDSTATRQTLTSPFTVYQAVPDTAADLHEKSNRTVHTTPQRRWQDAAKRVAGRSALRFKADTVTDTNAGSPEDTANRSSPLSRSVLEPKTSGFSRISSNLKLSNLGKSLSENKAQATAFSEVVRIAQQQQQANRQSAAPVLKAVPSTKVSFLL